MVLDLPQIGAVTGIGEYEATIEEITKNENALKISRTIYKKGSKAFLVVNSNTIEIRTDAKLASLLKEKYESVMESRYFGRGGIEIVLAGHQLEESELADLIRLSYNLS